MKKATKISVAALLILCFCSIFVACNDPKADNDDHQAVYNVTTAYAEAQSLGYTGSLEEFIASISGKDGANGKDGVNGQNGADGKDGVGIKSVKITDDKLIVTLTDDSVLDLGSVRGAKGDKGEDGQNGTNGHSPIITIGDNGNWFIDGTDTGKTSVGADGQNGSNGQNGQNGSDGNDGHSPVITIGDNGNWFIDDVDTGKTALPVNGGELLSYLINNADTYTVYGRGTVSDRTIAVPETYRGKAVTSLSPYAFADDPILASVSLPEGLLEIGESAFEECAELTEITIPSTVEKVEENAFSGCSKLKINYNGTRGQWQDVNVDENSGISFVYCTDGLFFTSYSEGLTFVTNSDGQTVTVTGYEGTDPNVFIPATYQDKAITNVGNGVFRNKTFLRSVYISYGIERIGYEAFANCSSLTQISLPDSIKYVEDDSFNGCPDSLFNVYDNVKYLGHALNPYLAAIEIVSADITECTVHPDCAIIASNAFDGCGDLVSVTLGTKIKYINDHAFNECNCLSEIDLPYGLSEICTYAFYNCSEFTSLYIPDTVTAIGAYAFGSCSSLQNVYISANVTVIPESAFGSCETLDVILLAGKITTVEEKAFEDCGEISDIYFFGSSEEWENANIDESNVALLGGHVYFYSLYQPIDEGLFWHYDTDGRTPLAW